MGTSRRVHPAAPGVHQLLGHADCPPARTFYGRGPLGITRGRGCVSISSGLFGQPNPRVLTGSSTFFVHLLSEPLPRWHHKRAGQRQPLRFGLAFPPGGLILVTLVAWSPAVLPGKSIWEMSVLLSAINSFLAVSIRQKP